MYGNIPTFNGVVRTLLVRYGTDEKLKYNMFNSVYAAMLLQICRDYPGLPDPRTLKAREIRFFYNDLRKELRKHTKPK